MVVRSLVVTDNSASTSCHTQTRGWCHRLRKFSLIGSRDVVVAIRRKGTVYLLDKVSKCVSGGESMIICAGVSLI